MATPPSLFRQVSKPVNSTKAEITSSNNTFESIPLSVGPLPPLPEFGASTDSNLKRQVSKVIFAQSENVAFSDSNDQVKISSSTVASEVDERPFKQPRFLNSSSSDKKDEAVNVLMVGTGEYTTGFVAGKTITSDKKAGVVALTMFDLRKRGQTARLALCGVSGVKFPAIRDHMKKCISDVYGLDSSCETFPSDDQVVPSAYLAAMDSFCPGDAAIVFTPDDTHFEIAMQAISRGMHVLITKPVVKTLDEHKALHAAAKAHNVLVAVEVHKRWDPMYIDARGEHLLFLCFNSYM
jgi:hypothetical protein